MQPEPTNPPRLTPIRISYRESADHLLEANEQATPSRQFRWGLWPAILLGIVFLTIFRAASERSYSGGINWKDVAISIGIVLFLAALLLLVKNSRAITRRWYRKVYRQRTGREESKVVCEFGDAALFVSTEGGVASQYPWSAIVRAVERPMGLLIYHGPGAFQWFPKTAFASEADYAATKRLLESKVADFRKPT
jgi:hypothetical protein